MTNVLGLNVPINCDYRFCGYSHCGKLQDSRYLPVFESFWLPWVFWLRNVQKFGSELEFSLNIFRHLLNWNLIHRSKSKIIDNLWFEKKMLGRVKLQTLDFCMVEARQQNYCYFIAFQVLANFHLNTAPS